jgi:cytochrome c biogenesis protein CcdA
MNASIIINFITAFITFIFGILLTTGIIFPGKVDTSKYMLGIVLIIYGVYRFVNSFSKMKQLKMEENRKKIYEEREKLLKNP